MTVYIAGPMTGRPNYNFDAFFAAEERLRREGYKVLNPAKIGLLPEYEMYWPINKAMIDGADTIYMLNGWLDSPGARREFEYAVCEVGCANLFEAGE